MINNGLKVSARGGSASGGKEIYILGAKINDLSLDEVINLIAEFLKNQQKGYLTTPNPEICLQSYQSKVFRRILQRAWLNIPDGFGLKIGAFIFGKSLKNLTTGIDLCWKLLELAEHKNYSILFFEGRPQIGDRALKVISQEYPNLKIKFLDPGKVDIKGNFENSDLIEQTNEFHPDIILVNFGPPKQENFINKNLDKLDTKLMLGIGGSLDFISGRIKRAPESWRKLGLEWLWRLIQEPWRWQRILKAVIIFPLTCLRWRFGNLFIYRKNVAGMIINSQKQILVCKHSSVGYWQLPQGGVKKAEGLNEAIIREVSEEIGTNKFEILDMVTNCYKYNWLKESRDFDKYKGQKQSLFLLKFTGENKDIKLNPREFTDYKWADKNEVLKIVPDFKGEIIKIGLVKFKKYL